MDELDGFDLFGDDAALWEQNQLDADERADADAQRAITETDATDRPEL
jgi:hypothetical protein